MRSCDAGLRLIEPSFWTWPKWPPGCRFLRLPREEPALRIRAALSTLIMSTSQLERALVFKALHESGTGFLIANPWDVGSARLLALAGFKALASTSAGYCFSRGMPDYSTSRDSVLDHLTELASATELPLSADLADGFGAVPDDVAETIQRAAAAGVVGASVEDHSGLAHAPLTELAQAVDRIRAAVEAARGLPFPFLVTARAENFMLPFPDIAAIASRDLPRP